MNPFKSESVATIANDSMESGKMTISVASRQDMDIAADLIGSSFEWYLPFISEKDYGEHKVDEAWKDRNFKLRNFYLGYLDDKPIGVLAIQTFGNILYVGYLYLDINYVGLGYGQQLLSYAKNEAVKTNLEAMVLLSHPKATWATKAYKKFGFEVILNSKDEILSWRNGQLVSYYEEDYQMFEYKICNAGY